MDHDNARQIVDLRAAQAEAVATELYQEALDPEYWEELDRQMAVLALGLSQQARAQGQPRPGQALDAVACERLARRHFDDLFEQLGMRVAPGPAVRFGWAGHGWELAAEEHGGWRLTRLDPCGPADRPRSSVQPWEPQRRLWVALYRLQYLPARCAEGG